MERRRFLAQLSATAAASACAGMGSWLPAAHAQSRPLRLLVGFPPGGSADMVARHFAEQLRLQLARPVVVENRAGASGRMAMEALKSARPDDEVLAVVPHGAVTLFPHIYKALRYDPMRDFSPIARLATFDYALSVGPATPARTLAEFLAWARTAGDKATYGSAGPGTAPHFVGVAFAQKTGMTLTHVAYRGIAPAMVDLAGGTIAAVFSPLAETIEQHRAGRIRLLATASEARSPLVTGVPTMREAGVDLVADGWFGLYGPASLAPARIQALGEATLAAVANPAFQERLAGIGLIASGSSPQQLAQLQREELAMWVPLVKASGFQPED